MMNTSSRWLLTLCLLLSVAAATAQPFKLSGSLREILADNNGQAASRRLADNQSCIRLIMKVTEAQQMASVCNDYGMLMVTDLGYIAVVDVPASNIAKAASDSRVVRMEKEGGFRFCLDEARKTANVNPIVNGESPLPQAYTGKGVIVGVLDGGVQYNHPTFLDANGLPRFRKIWDFDIKDGQLEPVVLTNAADILARQYSNSSCNGVMATNHGSHVAAIAVGSGRYRGMAPESDIIFSDATMNPLSERSFEIYSDYLLTSVKNMTDYATEQQQPLVINISLGNNLGFSTESKLLQEAFSLLTGPGRIIVAANGNEGNVEEMRHYFHSGSNLTESIVLKGESMPMSYDIIWKTSGALSFSLDISMDTDNNTETFSTSQLTDGMLPAVERAAYTKKFLQLEDAPDGKHIYRLRFIPKEARLPFSVTAAVTGEQSFEAFSKMLGIVSATPAEGCTISNAYTSAIPGVFSNVVAVGNYCNRVLPNGVEDVVGVMNNSSSWGPTWDGRNKPDVSAPGSIISAGNSYSPRNADEVVESYDIAGSDAKETWVGQSGSSQASPTVAGIVALWLQAKPDLSPDDVFSIIKKTSHAIEPIPNNHSGAGIIDAYAGMLEVLNLPASVPSLSRHQPENVNFRLVGDVLYADGADEGTPVTVYNLTGTVCLKATIQQGSIALNGLQSGVYAIQFGTAGSTLIRK
jgi:subtilisin family serine protease